MTDQDIIVVCAMCGSEDNIEEGDEHPVCCGTPMDLKPADPTEEE